MYHEIPTAIIGSEGPMSWYVVADIPQEVSRRVHGRTSPEWSDLRRRGIEEWRILEPLLDPSTRVADGILIPDSCHEGEWWAGYLADILGVIEGRRGRRSQTRRVLCAHLDSAAWRVIAQRRHREGAPVADRWSGVTKSTFAHEQSQRILDQANRELRWETEAVTLSDLEAVEEEARTAVEAARERVRKMHQEVSVSPR